MLHFYNYYMQDQIYFIISFKHIYDQKRCQSHYQHPFPNQEHVHPTRPSIFFPISSARPTIFKNHVRIHHERWQRQEVTERKTEVKKIREKRKQRKERPQRQQIKEEMMMERQNISIQVLGVIKINEILFSSGSFIFIVWVNSRNNGSNSKTSSYQNK